jgi:hypothetical protein
MRRKYLIAFVLVVILCFGLFIIFPEIFGKNYQIKDAIENYVQNEPEFTDLVSYFNSKAPDPRKNRGVIFGLGDASDRITMGLYLLDGSVIEKDPIMGGTNMKIGSSKMDTLLRRLGWTIETVSLLKEKLEKANCINISSQDSESVSIDFRYSGWGLFSYSIFNQPLPDSLIDFYNGKGDTVIGKKVVIKYSSSH